MLYQSEMAIESRAPSCRPCDEQAKREESTWYVKRISLPTKTFWAHATQSPVSCLPNGVALLKVKEEKKRFEWNTQQVVLIKVWFEPVSHDAWVPVDWPPQRRSSQSHWHFTSGRQRWTLTICMTTTDKLTTSEATSTTSRRHTQRAVVAPQVNRRRPLHGRSTFRHRFHYSVTVFKTLVLRPLLEDRQRITESMRIMVPVNKINSAWTWHFCIPCADTFTVIGTAASVQFTDRELTWFCNCTTANFTLAYNAIVGVHRTIFELWAH